MEAKNPTETSDTAAENSQLLSSARTVLCQESEALSQLARQLDDSFCQAIRLIDQCKGCVLICGMGKAGLIGQKVMATMGSLGVRSHFLHPAEAVHGDLGRVRSDDCIIMFSQSGQTEEIIRLLGPLTQMNVPIIAITGNRNSTLAQHATIILDLDSPREACPMGLAPSTSTTMMLALGDALALVLSQLHHFSKNDFARNHPAGSLGRQLSPVDVVMRPLGQCRIASQHWTIRRVFGELSRPGRRTGAIMLINDQGKLSGVFTDSDLAKLFERNDDSAWDKPIEQYMTRRPWVVLTGTLFADAVELISERKISELPVIDTQGCPCGLLDITDVVGSVSSEKITSMQNYKQQNYNQQNNLAEVNGENGFEGPSCGSENQAENQTENQTPNQTGTSAGELTGSEYEGLVKLYSPRRKIAA